MKTFLNQAIGGQQRRARQSATTLPEMMTTLFIFMMTLAALLYTHMFGLKQDQLVESKLGASDHARKGFGIMSREIRSAATHAVGSYSGGVFNEIAAGVLQQGNAIRLCFGTNKLFYTTNIYYFDTTLSNNFRLMRKRNNSTANMVAGNLTNSLTFTAEEYSGTATTNNSDRKIIHFTLDFLQYQYPLTKVGSGGGYLYDRFKMDFRVTPHVPQGR
jgi:hypothetical protein